MKQPGKAIGSGVAGGIALTLVHQTLKRFVPQAPRMDLLGMQALEKMLDKGGLEVPQNKTKLYNQALFGDLVSNSLYYSVAGVGKKPWITGLIAGAAAGIAAVTLPKKLGLNEENVNRSVTTTILTIGLYTLGGVVSAGIASLLAEKEEELIEGEKNLETQQQSWNLKD